MASRLMDRIAVVIHPDDRDRFESAVQDLDGKVEVVLGGPTRQASVRQALLAFRAAPPDIVLIHDAVRPFVEPSLIATVVHSLGDSGGALPALPISDTLKRVSDSGDIVETIPRDGLFAAQTPQGFLYNVVADAHEAAAAQQTRQFTDDASLVEWAGGRVVIVPGSPENVKLTVARDIVAADRKLRGEQALIDVRTGNGYDVHQLVQGDHVTLCGVRIAHDQALSGHSDADVGLHALTDALLATCGAGDIGDHFPPSDPQWRGAASRRFIEHAVHVVSSKGGRIANADVTLICEAPKIAPHREAMRAAIAEMTGLTIERVSVKATTNESIGFVGRREGIAAIATASVSFTPAEPST